MRVAKILPLLLVMFSSTVFAADPPKPAPLVNLEKQGAAIRYLGKDGGLDGWVTIKNGQEQYFYVTPDQQAIVLGVLFNAKGDVVTMRQINDLRKKDPSVDALAEAQNSEAPAAASASVASEETKSGPSKAQQLYAEVEAASWVALGEKSAPAIYSFIDPQCPHCHDMIEDFRKSGLLEKGQVQLRLIPVGLMNEDSLKQAANLIESSDPASVLYKHLDGDKEALLSDKDPNTQSVQRNMVLMQSWKLDVTPFSVYKNKAGEIKIIRGRPENLKKLVTDLK